MHSGHADHLPDTDSDPAALAVEAWQPFRGPFQRWPLLMDVLLALLALFLTLAMWSQSAGPSGLGLDTPVGFVTLVLVVVGNIALVWRRRHPVRVHIVILACSVLVLMGPMLDGVFALAFSLYSLGRYAEDDRASLVGMLAAVLFASVDLFVLGSPGPGNVVAAGLVVLLWYVGRRLRFRGEYLRLLEERAEHLERRKTEDAERAVAEERTRIARELHDIVAHQVSLMTVQAGAAKTVARSDPEAAVGAMSAVENAGRQALAEMRHLLDVLRPGGAVADLGPQPGCADLPRLVAEVNEAGPNVRLETEGVVTGLPARVDLAVYRIVQEALTNVLKHAGPGAEAVVRVRASGSGIEIGVSDDGRGPGNRPGSGHGIAGMRERAEQLGGSLSAGPGPLGGFEVRAFVPIPGQRS